jgi:hypothetical protein
MAAPAGVAAPASQDTDGHPVLLATLGVPFDEEAAAVAVDAAVEAGQALIVANCVQLPPLPMSVVLGLDQIDDPDEAAAIRAPAELAQALGVRVERLRVKSLRPVDALLELVGERRPGLLVFGPDRSKLGRRTYRKAVKAVREHARCLVWLG